MQRTSNSTLRITMVVCLAIIILLTFLYLMKRIESNKNLRELNLLKIESHNLEEEMNAKIVQYMERVESLTQENTLVKGQLTKMQSEKSMVYAEIERAKKSLVDCRAQVDKMNTQLNQVMVEMETAVKAKNDALGEAEDLQTQLREIKKDNSNLDGENHECERENEQLQNSLNSLKTNFVKSDECTTQLTLLRSQIQSLTVEKQNLQSKLTGLQVAQNTLISKSQYPRSNPDVPLNGENIRAPPQLPRPLLGPLAGRNPPSIPGVPQNLAPPQPPRSDGQAPYSNKGMPAPAVRGGVANEEGEEEEEVGPNDDEADHKTRDSEKAKGGSLFQMETEDDEEGDDEEEEDGNDEIEIKNADGEAPKV